MGQPPLQYRDGIRVVRVGPASTFARRAYGAVNRVLGSPRGQTPRWGASRQRGRPTSAPSGRGVARPVACPPAGPVGHAADFYLRGTRLVVRLRPRIVHCNDYNTMWIGVAAKLLCRSAVIYDSHELWPDRNLRPEARWWLLALRVALRARRRPRRDVEPGARRGRGAPLPRPRAGRRAEHPRAGTPPSEEALDREGGERGDGAVAIYVGGVLRHRGIEESIGALARADGVRLRLLGPVDSAYREELVRLARAEGVEERVEFAAPVPPSEVVATLAEADVGLALFQPTCLSHRLVLPNKLFEYVLAGLPVVGSDLPMIAKFVEEHGVGAAVDPGDADAIARALEETLRPEQNRELRAAARRARASIDWREESELLAGVYREALAA